MKKVNINFTNKWLYSITFAILLIAITIGVYAYTTIPNPGHGADTIIVDVDGNEMTLQEAIDSGSFGSETNIDFQWVPESVGCNSDYIDTQIRDDEDSTTSLGENNFAGGTMILCISGVNAVEWVLKSNGCSSGYTNTGLEDDKDDNHNLNEGGGNDGTMFCIDGIQEVDWVGNCQPGWTPAHLWDDLDEYHRLTENQDGRDSIQLCVR